MIDAPNPYKPPSTGSSDRAKPETVNGAEVFATCVRRTWLGRELQLSGGLNAVIRYNAAAIGEKVFVNDELVATSSAWHMSVVAPQIDFEIRASDTIFPATIHVYAAWLQLFRVIRFSLVVNGHLLYVEPENG